MIALQCLNKSRVLPNFLLIDYIFICIYIYSLKNFVQLLYMTLSYFVRSPIGESCSGLNVWMFYPSQKATIYLI